MENGLIIKVWLRLGGGDLAPAGEWHRGKPFWRESKRADSLALNPKANTWTDHGRSEGGGIIKLVMAAKGCARGDALAWLKKEGFSIGRETPLPPPAAPTPRTNPAPDPYAPVQRDECVGPKGKRVQNRFDTPEGKKIRWEVNQSAENPPAPRFLCYPLRAYGEDKAPRAMVFTEGIKAAKAVAAAGYKAVALMTGAPNAPDAELLKWLHSRTESVQTWVFWADNGPKDKDGQDIGLIMMEKAIERSPYQVDCGFATPPSDIVEGGDAADCTAAQIADAITNIRYIERAAQPPKTAREEDQWDMREAWLATPESRLFVSQGGTWLYYDGEVWAEDYKRGVILESIARLAKKNEIKVSESFARGVSALCLAQRKREGAAWDADPYLLNMRGAAINLRDGSQRPQSPEDYCKHIIRRPPSEDQTCPTFEGILDNFTQDSPETAMWLWEYLSTCVIGAVMSQSFLLIEGRGGEGKSMLLYGLRQALGDYATTITADSILEPRFPSPNSPKPSLAALHGKRCCFISEIKDLPLDTSVLKTMTGDDLIEARFLHQNTFTFESKATIIMTANTLPYIKDSSIGFWRRVRILRVTGYAPKEPQLESVMKSRLRDEAPAILNRLISVAQDVIREGGVRPPPEYIEVATEAFRAQVDPFGVWLDGLETCDPKDGMDYNTIARAFVYYTDSNTFPFKTENGLGRYLSHQGIERKRIMRNRRRAVLYGIRIPNILDALPSEDEEEGDDSLYF